MQTDNINKPNHYQGAQGLEAIDVIRNFAGNLTAEQGFYWGNAIKYMLRFQKKNGVEDLKKAKKNLEWLIESIGGQTMQNQEQIRLIMNWERDYYRLGTKYKNKLAKRPVEEVKLELVKLAESWNRISFKFVPKGAMKIEGDKVTIFKKRG